MRHLRGSGALLARFALLCAAMAAAGACTSSSASGGTSASATDDASVNTATAPTSQVTPYVFAQDGTAWTESAAIASPDGDSGFGVGVVIHGGNLAVGASFEHVATVSTGAVYLYAADGADWTEQMQIVAPDSAAEAAFGQSVTLMGSSLVVGAPSGGPASHGAAYIFGPGHTNAARAPRSARSFGAADAAHAVARHAARPRGAGRPRHLERRADAARICAVPSAAVATTFEAPAHHLRG